MVEMIGPFMEEYRVTVDGYKVPYLRAYPRNPQQTEWTLVLDDRFGLDLPAELLNEVVSFIANCMAVSAGYSSHGANSIEVNPFKTQLARLEGLEGNETDPVQ